ncbi:DUF3397 domain-containing protein [Streptococcus massiliensis]|uniref:DUF3397 domain-containing protein n=1 Tax=Streptococcus massiliensis TaxID=313439 RepID=UPI0003821EE0|nr:DUF3397 domain-containing protein [Streptococcus massiliensis]
MLLLRIAAILFIFLNIFVSIVFVKLFRLQKRGFNFADLAFPLFFVEFYLISDRAFYHSLLPQLVFALSLLAIGLSIFFLVKRRSFYYPKFFRYFWRAGFLLTFFLYLAMIISLFLVNGK